MTTDEEIYNLIKDAPDFDCFPIPASWYEKFKIAPHKTLNPHEFVESEYTMKIAFQKKDLPPIVINEPQQGGKLMEVPAFEEPKVEVITRPFELKEGEAFPDVLPSLKDETASQQVQ